MPHAEQNNRTRTEDGEKEGEDDLEMVQKKITVSGSSKQFPEPEHVSTCDACKPPSK